MPYPLARTYDEAMLYLQLQPCPSCFTSTTQWSSGLTRDDGAMARRYWTTCATCGADREYTFRLPQRPLLPPPGTPVLFGGDDPSQLLDAGEWLRVADMCARSAVPVSRDDGQARFDAAGAQALAVAVAAMEEVLKFLPAGRDEAPDDAFWSEAGQQVRDREPGRFDRDRLDVVRRSYRTQLHGAT